jgi:hypothetical protein
MVQELPQHGRHEVHCGDAGPLDDVGEVSGIEVAVRSSDHERSAGQ